MVIKYGIAWFFNRHYEILLDETPTLQYNNNIIIKTYFASISTI